MFLDVLSDVFVSPNSLTFPFELLADIVQFFEGLITFAYWNNIAITRNQKNRHKIVEGTKYEIEN